MGGENLTAEITGVLAEVPELEEDDLIDLLVGRGHDVEAVKKTVARWFGKL